MSNPSLPIPFNACSDDNSNNSIHVLSGNKSDVLLLEALRCLEHGNFSVRLNTSELLGVDKEIADTLNHILDFQHHFCDEIDRVSVLVGKEGMHIHM